MNILLATDIFGYTNAIEELKQRLSFLCKDVYILDPYEAKCMDFHDESEAYEAFLQRCGLEHYATLCVKALAALSNKAVILIGFSMGASAMWKALDGLSGENIKAFYGFYASQIRHFLEVKPLIPCTLIFPKCEKHFDVDEVIANLIHKETLTCIKSSYLHGFMNPSSLNYDANGYREYCRWLESCLLKDE